MLRHVPSLAIQWILDCWPVLKYHWERRIGQLKQENKQSLQHRPTTTDDPVISDTNCLRRTGPIEWDTLKQLVDKLALGTDEDKLYQDYTVLN